MRARLLMTLTHRRGCADPARRRAGIPPAEGHRRVGRARCERAARDGILLEEAAAARSAARCYIRCRRHA